MFKLEEKWVETTGITERDPAAKIPKCLGSIWASPAKPMFLNPVVIARKAGPGVTREFAEAGLTDFFRAVTELCVNQEVVDLDFGFAHMRFNPATRKIGVDWGKELLTWVANAEAKAREENRHAVGHRRLFEVSTPVSEAWRYPPEMRQPAHKQLVRTGGASVHRPMSATTTSSERSLAERMHEVNATINSSRPPSASNRPPSGSARPASGTSRPGSALRPAGPTGSPIPSGSRPAVTNSHRGSPPPQSVTSSLDRRSRPQSASSRLQSH